MVQKMVGENEIERSQIEYFQCIRFHNVQTFDNSISAHGEGRDARIVVAGGYP